MNTEILELLLFSIDSYRIGTSEINFLTVPTYYGYDCKIIIIVFSDASR